MAESHRILKIGIECESIESDTWGIAQIINRILAEIARRPELANEFRFYLYFKSKIPDYPFLRNPIFEKRVVRLSFLPVSFSIYYYVLLPIRMLFDNLHVAFFPNYMLPLIFFGKSLVLSAHDVYYEARNKNIPFRYRLAYRIFATWAAKHATRVQAMSDFGKKELMNVFQITSERISVNHLGVDHTNLIHLPNYNRPYVLFVGQAFPRRHLREALLAFEKIAQTRPDFDFRIVGVDKYTPPIVATVLRTINSRLGSERIIWKQRVETEQLESLYAGATAVLYISSKEAFGLPPLEALSYGSYPIVADTELTHELFGAHAFFVENPDSVDDIAHVLVRSITDTAHRALIDEFRFKILDRFTWKAHTDRFLATLKQIAHA